MVWASGVGVVVSEFFDKEANFLRGVGGSVFFYKLTSNPNLTFFFFFFLGGGGGGRGGEGEGKCTCMNKCFKWHFYSPRRTPVKVIL